MTLRVSRSLLEAALLNIMNEEDPPADSADAPANTTPPANQPAAPPPPEDKTGRAAFDEKVKELNAVPDGKEYAAGNDTFVKKSGKWYLSQVEGVQGFDDAGLLTLVNDGAKEDIAAKIEKDKKNGYNLGVTIRGDQFIGGGTAKSATFDRKEGGLYLDNTVIPTEIVAQYWFEEVQGNTDMGAIAASLMGEQGVQAKAFIRDEFAYVIQDSDLYILGTGNQNNPLEATRNLLEKLGTGIGGTNRLAVLKEADASDTTVNEPGGTGGGLRYDPGTTTSDSAAARAAVARSDAAAAEKSKKSFKDSKLFKQAADAASRVADAAVYTNYEKYATTLLSYRKYLNPGSNQTFSLMIDDLQGLGELRDKIRDSRTLAGKFFDLFSKDDIKMTFVITQWGPAFVRKQMFGTRGGDNIRGAMSREDIKAFEDTGLFREIILPQMDTDVTYVAKGGRPTDFTGLLTGDVEVKLSYIGVERGFEVTGIEKIEKERYGDFEQAFQNTFADAYFLFYPPTQSHKKVIDLKGAPPPAPVEAAPTAPAPTAAPPAVRNDPKIKDKLGKPLGPENGAVYFKFNSDQIEEQNPTDYMSLVVDDFITILNSVDAEYLQYLRKYEIGIIVTSDPVGKEKDNDALAKKRGLVIKNELEKILNQKVSNNVQLGNISKVIVYEVGEKPWQSNQDVYLKLGSDTDAAATTKRKYLRFAKAYFGDFSVDLEDTVGKAKAIGDAKMKEQNPDITLNESVRHRIRRILKETNGSWGQ